MVPVGAWSFFAGIWLTQSGDPLAHGHEGILHCASADRLPGGWGDASAAAEPVDKDEAEAGFEARDVTQGGVRAVLGAEGGPVVEDDALATACLGDNRGVCGLQRSAEISSEAISGRRGSGVQDGGCGKCWRR
jgi:hypothetical protein